MTTTPIVVSKSLAPREIFVDYEDVSPAMPMIYVAGPFRGATPLDVRRNVENARDVGFMVAQAGGFPMIPHTMTADFDKQLSDEFWLEGTLKMLSRCDGICMTPMWPGSKGATAEWNWAQAHKMDCYYTSLGEVAAGAIDGLEHWIGVVARSIATERERRAVKK